MKVRIHIPVRLLGVHLFSLRLNRQLSTDWQEVSEPLRFAFLRAYALLPLPQAQAFGLKKELQVPKFLFKALMRAVSQEDRCKLLSMYAFLDLQACVTPPIARFKHGGREYALPLPKFEGVTAFEFVTANEHYEEWGEVTQTQVNTHTNILPLLRLVATLCRPYDAANEAQTGDPRQSLATSFARNTMTHDIEQSAMQLTGVDFSVAVVMIRYFEGVREMVFRGGIASGLFQAVDEAPQKKTKKQGTVKDKVNSKVWWQSFRVLARSQHKTEEQIWQMSFWRVFLLLIEEHQRQISKPPTLDV